jgi:hypothetical protein
MKVYIPTLKEYSELEDKLEFENILRYSAKFKEPIDHFKIGVIADKTFGEVKDLQFLIDKRFDVFNFLEYLISIGIKEETFPNTSMLKISQGFNYLINQVRDINENESKLLAGDGITDEQIEAGIEDLNDLSIYLQKRDIAMRFSKSIKEIEFWPYTTCLLEMVTAKKIRDYEERLTSIRFEKQKNK